MAQLAQLQSLINDPSANAFEQAGNSAYLLVIGRVPEAVPALLITLAVLFSIGIPLAILITINRWIEDSLWVSRWRAGLWTPHGVDISAFALIVFCSLAAADLWLFHQTPPFAITRAMVFFAGIVWTSFAVQVFLEIIELEIEKREDSNSQPTSRKSHHASLVNTLSFGGSLVIAAVAIALSVATVVVGLDPTLDAYDQLRSALLQLAANGATNFDAATLSPVFPLVDQLNSAAVGLAHWLRILFAFWLAQASLLLIVAVPLRFQHLRYLGRRLALLRTTRAGIARAQFDPDGEKTARTADERVKALVYSYIFRTVSLFGMSTKLTQLTLTGAFIAASCLIAITAIIVADPERLLHKAERLWGCVLGAFAAALVFWALPLMLFAANTASEAPIEGTVTGLGSLRDSEATIALQPAPAAQGIQIKVDRTHMILNEDGEEEGYDLRQESSDSVQKQETRPQIEVIQHESELSTHQPDTPSLADTPSVHDTVASVQDTAPSVHEAEPQQQVDPAVYQRLILEDHSIM